MQSSGRIEASDVRELERAVPLVVDNVGGVTIEDVTEEGEGLVAQVSAYTLENGSVKCITTERRVIVDARHRFDRERLLLWWNRIRSALRRQAYSQLCSMGYEIDVRALVPCATATVRGLGPWRVSGRLRWTLRNRLPAWAHSGATIVKLPDRDAVYCTDERQFDGEAAAKDGFGAIPCLKDYLGPTEPRRSRGVERERTADILDQAGEQDAAFTEIWAVEAQRLQTWRPPHGVSDMEPVTGILFVPAQSEVEAIAALRFGDFNACPPTAVHVAILHRWKERFGICIHGIGFDTMQVSLGRLPDGAAETGRVWFELQQLSPDAWPKDPRDPIWQLWWD